MIVKYTKSKSKSTWFKIVDGDPSSKDDWETNEKRPPTGPCQWVATGWGGDQSGDDLFYCGWESDELLQSSPSEDLHTSESGGLLDPEAPPFSARMDPTPEFDELPLLDGPPSFSFDGRLDPDASPFLPPHRRKQPWVESLEPLPALPRLWLPSVLLLALTLTQRPSVLVIRAPARALAWIHLPPMGSARSGSTRVAILTSI